MEEEENLSLEVLSELLRLLKEVWAKFLSLDTQMEHTLKLMKALEGSMMPYNIASKSA